METIIHTESGVRVCVDQWDDSGVWLGVQVPGASAYSVLTHAEALELLAGLTKILGA